MASDSIPKIQAGNLFSVNGLNAVITGGGSGLGAMMARALATNGANKVFIIGRRAEALENTVKSIPNGSETIIPITGDITSKDDLRAAVEKVKSYVQHIDVVIPNSGVGGPPVAFMDKDKKPLPLSEVADTIFNQDLDKAIDPWRVNFIGLQYTIGAFLPLMDAANKARPSEPSVENFKPRPQIITTGSVGGYNRQPFAGLCYGPSKAAVIQLTKMLSTAMIPYDIRVNCIAPGLYLTEMTEDQYKAQGRDKSHNVEGTFPKDVVPATRTGDLEDISGAVLFLCSRAGAYINGNILVTDGGRLSAVPASY